MHEQVTVVAVLEGIQHQIHGIRQSHHEAGHVRVGQGQRLAGADLLDEQRDHRTARGHHVAVTGAADHRLALVDIARLGDHDLFHHRLGDAHGVDRVDRLVGAQADHALDLVLDRRFQHVLGADHVGLDRFHRVKLAGRHLFERCRMEDVIHAAGGIQHALVVAHIADIELQLGVGIALAHVILLLLVTAEDADFSDVGVEEALEDGISKGAGAAGDEKGFSVEQSEAPGSMNSLGQSVAVLSCSGFFCEGLTYDV
ncbi:hypothetical protein D3C78_1220820 [compost metagenome]